MDENGVAKQIEQIKQISRKDNAGTRNLMDKEGMNQGTDFFRKNVNKSRRSVFLP